ncbi:MAG: T9SS type A sorting domain-containing protein, partial [bacterium]
FVSLKVFDVLGKEIATLEQKNIERGNHSVTWKADGIPSGVYFYRYAAGDFVQTKKMVLLK